MSALPAIRYVASSAKLGKGIFHLQCHVKPGASKQREGIISASDTMIEVCVAAQAREGEANKAVMDIFSKALDCPKADVTIVRGMKSRDKTVAIAGCDFNINEQTSISRIRRQWKEAIG